MFTRREVVEGGFTMASSRFANNGPYAVSSARRKHGENRDMRPFKEYCEGIVGENGQAE
jgi:hypothetical protein